MVKIKEKHIYFKSRQSFENKRGLFRTYFNQVRSDKTSKYHKVDTRHYNSLIDEMKDQHDMEYICAGLNSHEREVIIVDCDDTDYGKTTFELLKRFNIIPHCYKVKPNGHSQFFFFIEKINISRGYFTGSKRTKNSVYHEEHFYEQHCKWKRIIKLMNVLFNGDIGFTGYNCQNPFYDNADTTWVKPLDELYNVDQLLYYLENHIQKTDIQEYITETIKRYYNNRKKKSLEEIKEKIIYHFEDEEQSALRAIEDETELKNQIAKLCEEKHLKGLDLINEIIKLQDNSINKRIFVLVSQVCKSFWKRNLLHDENKFDEIVFTALKHWNYQDTADGYTYSELLNRIQYDVREIIEKDSQNIMLWNKVGYTKLQRNESLRSRRIKMNDKRSRVYKLLKKNSKYYSQLSLNHISQLLSEQYYKLYNENISTNTIKNYLLMKFKNNLLYLRRYLIKNKLIIHHNNKLVGNDRFDKVSVLFLESLLENNNLRTERLRYCSNFS